MPFWVDRLRRQFDRKPIAAHLYVTDRCNLDCWYCTEFDNTVPHPPLDALRARIAKLKELGCIRVGLQGGEPLSHPDIVEVVRCCKAAGLKTTMSTNGLLLTRDLARGLADAGLDGLQVSVDRMAGTPSTRKGLTSILPKLRHLREAGMRFNITGVLFQETIEEAYQVLDYGLGQGWRTHARLIHAGPDGEYGVAPGDREALRAFLDFQIAEKRRGRAVHTNWRTLRYQQALLDGRAVDWTCLAGYKYFFVSAQGKFWLCSMNREPDLDLMAVTPELLESYFRPKPCQPGCGVYCVVSESLSFNHPARFLAREAADRAATAAARLWGRRAPGQTDPARPPVRGRQLPVVEPEPSTPPAR